MACLPPAAFARVAYQPSVVWWCSASEVGLPPPRARPASRIPFNLAHSAAEVSVARATQGRLVNEPASPSVLYGLRGRRFYWDAPSGGLSPQGGASYPI